MDVWTAVGRLPGGVNASRTHLSAWAIVSAPLILGLDVTDDDIMDSVWPVITNREVLAINSHWAGHPGRHVHSFTPPELEVAYLVPTPCNGSKSQMGWAIRWQQRRCGGLDRSDERYAEAVHGQRLLRRRRYARAVRRCALARTPTNLLA